MVPKYYPTTHPPQDQSTVINRVKDFSCFELRGMIQTCGMANSKAKVSIKASGDVYCLVVDGEESEYAPYGDPIEMETSDGRRFLALLEAQGTELEAVTEFWAYEVLPVVDVPIVEEEEDDEEDDGDGGEGDDEDEEEEVEVEDTTTK